MSSRHTAPMTQPGSHDHNGGARLVAMANDIAAYFRPQSRDEAVAGIAAHIERFWTPRMRAKLNAFLASGATGTEALEELPRAAIARLNERETAKSPAG